ncbi:hypothetical protein SDC9_210192 [bioreactor metagenome]|uniref:Uncharacterized protein n=1 Tax=bioreactor metagenome TaxID=1076179 RepID=A0A645JQB2_9ZZZZ
MPAMGVPGETTVSHSCFESSIGDPEEMRPSDVIADPRHVSAVSVNAEIKTASDSG